MNVFLRNFGYCLLILTLMVSCSKDEGVSESYADPVEIITEQDGQILQYIRNHNLSMVKDSSGMYYKILDAGDSTAHMTLNSVPTIIYTRSNLKDSLLDASFGATDFDGRKLKDHIAGWQIGLQKVGKGGAILMIIPSPLGFGNMAVGNIIPANTVLVCNVEVVDFK